jgi:hypothetical protein
MDERRKLYEKALELNKVYGLSITAISKLLKISVSAISKNFKKMAHGSI